MKTFALTLGACFALLTWSCDAPRDNPFDPNSDNYVGPDRNIGIVSGNVADLSSAPLSGVQVFTIPEYRGAVTNPQGNYTIEGLSLRTYQIVCAPAGFEPDTAGVDLTDDAVATVNFTLDALPSIVDFKVISHFIDPSQQLPPYYLVSAFAAIFESDGESDLQYVTLHVQSGFSTPMIYDSTRDLIHYYSKNLLEAELPGASIDSVGDKLFWCTAEDQGGNSDSSKALFIARFFDNYPFLLSPIDDETVSTPTPTLRWEAFNAPFYFTYHALVYNGQNNPPLVWEKADIGADVTMVITDSLPNSNYYYWTLEVSDIFGNTALSAPVDFNVLFIP
jgi:hypothetical protein